MIANLTRIDEETAGNLSAVTLVLDSDRRDDDAAKSHDVVGRLRGGLEIVSRLSPAGLDNGRVRCFDETVVNVIQVSTILEHPHIGSLRSISGTQSFLKILGE
jgi:hypothetical protein